MYRYETPVNALRGVGPAREKALAACGIFTIGDLLHHLPRAYQNRGDVRLLADDAAANDGLPHAFLLTVSAEPRSYTVRRGMNLLRFRAFDDSATVEITYFNQPYLKDIIHTGAMFRFFGKLQMENGNRKMSSPILEPWREDISLPEIVPVYPLSAGLSQKFLATLIREALRLTGGQEADFLSEEILRSEQLVSSAFALANIHFPADAESLANAKKRITFDELAAVSAAIALGRDHKADDGAFPVKDRDLTPFLRALPFSLTGAQSRAVEEIAADMSRNIPMNRILTGDVGSGKTVCAAAAVYLAVKNGAQAALMVPTEILATQHFRDLEPLLGSLGFRTALLTGSVPAGEKRRICEHLANAEIDCVIGTHALITDTVRFQQLGLVITDEQHRFGVMQRAALAEKSHAVHTLVMSATPIPRTLSLIAYGDLALSRIDEMPPGRQKVETFVVGESYRERLHAFIRKQAAEGHQVYVVCPAVEESPQATKKQTEDAEEWANIPLSAPLTEEHPPLKAATKYAADLAKALPDLRVGFIHGKLKTNAKDSVMRSFQEGELDVLVSTTVIEVGVNVPNATLMIVENAERFGLSQLHQLRGRVGRGNAKSYCVLVSDAEGETAKRRLGVMKKTSNGYTIAEEDLAIRGPGDFWVLGGEARQSGEARLTLAARCTDPALIEAASRVTAAILKADPSLSSSDNAALKSRVDALQLATVGTNN